jgi:hypothetical protein
MALTDSAIKNAKPKAAQYKLHDEKGLFAIVRPNRAAHWDERVTMAQWWSDYLDMLRSGAQVLEFKQAAAG